MSSSLKKEDFYRFMDSGTGFFTREQVVEALMPEWDDSPERLLKRVVSWSNQHRDMVTLPRKGFAFAPRIAEGCVMLQPIDREAGLREMKLVPELSELVGMVGRSVKGRASVEASDGSIFPITTRRYGATLPRALVRWIMQLDPAFDAVEVRYLDRAAGRLSLSPTTVDHPVRDEADARDRAILVNMLSGRGHRDWDSTNLFLGLLVRGAFRETAARPMFYNLFHPAPLVRRVIRTVAIRGLTDSQVAWAMSVDAEWAIDVLAYHWSTGGLALPDATALPTPLDGVYRLKVAMKYNDFSATIDVPATMSFYQLHVVILDAVGFDDDHLWVFSLGTSRASAIDFGAVENAFDPDVELGELALERGQTLTFLFDFGDSWTFDIEVQNYHASERIKAAQVVKQHGKAPKQYAFEEEDGEAWE